MVDISLFQLFSFLPGGTATEVGDDVVVSLKTLLSEISVGIDSELSSELIVKLLQAGIAAQVEFNEDANNLVKIQSFGQPFLGTPTTVNSTLVVPYQQIFNALLPLGVDSALPLPV